MDGLQRIPAPPCLVMVRMSTMTRIWRCGGGPWPGIGGVVLVSQALAVYSEAGKVEVGL